MTPYVPIFPEPQVRTASLHCATCGKGKPAPHPTRHSFAGADERATYCLWRYACQDCGTVRVWGAAGLHEPNGEAADEGEAT